MSRIRIGVSGWQYKTWERAFYPADLPRRRQLEYATLVLGAVEVNGTFYSLKTPVAYEGWYAAAAPGSVLALKGSRYITHTRRLRDPAAALANFFANGLLRLEDKLGPILWQLPPGMRWEPEVFAAFCAALPRDTTSAARLGRGHDARVVGKVSLHVDRNRGLRHAFEIRDPRMLHDDALKILQRDGHALVVADSAGRYPYSEDITAGWVYVRLHGSPDLYASRYDDHAVKQWARRIRRWSRGELTGPNARISRRSPPRRRSRDVYVFFDNDARGHAPFDALRLHRELGQARDPDAIVDAEGTRLPPPPGLTASRRS